MRIFGRDKQKPIVEKPLITYYAKYVGHLSSNLSIPTTEPIYCHIYRDRIVIDFLNRPNKGKLVTVAYDAMTEIGNLDGGKKADWNRAAPLAIIALPLVLAGGFLKRQAVITVIKYRLQFTGSNTSYRFLGRPRICSTNDLSKILGSTVKKYPS